MKFMTTGTPKDLQGASENGLTECLMFPTLEPSAIIAAHNIDFIKQVLSSYVLKYDSPECEETLRALKNLEIDLCKMDEAATKSLKEVLGGQIRSAK